MEAERKKEGGGRMGKKKGGREERRRERGEGRRTETWEIRTDGCERNKVQIPP